MTQNKVTNINSKQEQPEQPQEEVKEDIWWISGEYLSAAAHMCAMQFVDDEENEWNGREEFVERLTYIYRQHCPIAYSFFFQQMSQAGQDVLPYGAVEVVLANIRQKKPEFLGGKKPSGIILPK